MNNRDIVDIKLCSNWGKKKKKISKPNSDHRAILSENCRKCSNDSILDLYRKIMSDFNYNFIRKKYKNKVCLINKDTGFPNISNRNQGFL